MQVCERGRGLVEVDSRFLLPAEDARSWGCVRDVFAEGYNALIFGKCEENPSLGPTVLLI